MALLAGGGQAVALADPVGGRPHGWLQMLTLAWLAWLLMDCAQRGGKPGRRGFLLGWLFALGWLGGTFWWLFISMHRYGGLPAPLAALAVLALAGALALYYGAAAAVFSTLFVAKTQVKPWYAALVFAASWTLAELARGSFFTGFPWGAGGYAHVDGWLAGYAPWIGVYGIGFAAAWIAAFLAFTGTRCIAWLFPRDGLRQQGPWAAMVIVTAVIALFPLYALPQSAQRIAQHMTSGSRAGAQPFMAVALLQGNIAQDEKFIPGAGVADSLAWYGQQLHAATAPLVVAPETALPLLPPELPAGYWEELQARYAQGGQAALIGVPLGDAMAGYTNSIAGLKPGQDAPYRYDKHHLVPFGEFVPPLFRWFTQLMNIPLGDFARGALVQPSFAWQGQRLAPNICYEDLFGEELAARFADPATAPTVLVNASNIAWFGDTVAIDQHLAISRMRALEFARPVLRATNTGATAIIDHRGAVTALLPRGTRGVLRGQFEGRAAFTPYARWVAKAGLWPLWALCLGALGWAAVFRAKRSTRNAQLF
jgi:apolipoprotein N-acyltransferase